MNEIYNNTLELFDKIDDLRSVFNGRYGKYIITGGCYPFKTIRYTLRVFDSVTRAGLFFFIKYEDNIVYHKLDKLYNPPVFLFTLSPEILEDYDETTFTLTNGRVKYKDEILSLLKELNSIKNPE